MVSDNSAKNQEIQHNTSDLTVAVHDIVKHINQVNLDVDDLARESKNISRYGQDISNLSSQLMSLVSKFEV
jgi:methyl-accepting chemotaxis protein